MGWYTYRVEKVQKAVETDLFGSLGFHFGVRRYMDVIHPGFAP